MKYLIAACALALLGCAMDEPRAFNPDLCVKSAAYELGYNDGHSPFRTMHSEFLSQCREDLRDEARSNYQSGYEKGHAELLKQQEENRKAQLEQERIEHERSDYPAEAVPAGTLINVNIGGRGGHEHHERWFCTVEAFMKKFEGMGPTQFDAKREAIHNCEKQYNQMHCEDAQCEIVH